MKKIVQTLNILLPLICFYFFDQLIDFSIFWWLIILLLITPNVLAYISNSWQKRSYYSGVLALLTVVLGTSVDLWTNLLNGTPINTANHLLAILFGIILAANLQMYVLQFKINNNTLSENEQVSQILKGPPLLLTLLLALIFVDCTLVLLLNSNDSLMQLLESKFLQRGIIPPLSLTLFYWGILLLLGKYLYVYNEMIAKNHQNLSKINDSSNNKNKFFETCWQQFEGFYALPKYINWAIPILGFIGTVLGISLATEGLSELLGTTETNFSQLLSEALSPLGIAFDTTLIALSLSIFLTLIQTLLYRWEEGLMMKFEQEKS